MKRLIIDCGNAEYEQRLKPFLLERHIPIVQEQTWDDGVSELPEADGLCDASSDTFPDLTFDPTAFRFEDISRRAERLFVAAMERETQDSRTGAAKVTVLACFWLAANFQTVQEALAHAYGDDPFPVGKGFVDFAKAFLSPEAYAEAWDIDEE